MLNMLYSFSLILSVFELFNISMRINIVNRAILATPKSIFESSVPLVFDVPNENIYLYFDKDVLSLKLTSYYDKSISKYTKNYTLNFYYFNKEDESICLGNQCQCVDVTVSANVFLNFTLTKHLEYEIKENFNG